MWPPFFPHPPSPPAPGGNTFHCNKSPPCGLRGCDKCGASTAPPAEPPIELGRCRYCQSYTERIVMLSGLEVAYVCPRKACCDDFDKEIRP